MSEMTWPFFMKKSSGFTYLGLAVAPAIGIIDEKRDSAQETVINSV